MNSPKRLLLSSEEIALSVARSAKEISREYANVKLHFVIVMKGALFFAADLLRELTIPCTFSYIQCSSYTGTSRREVEIVFAESTDLSDCAVIILDDIFDTGSTLYKVVKYYQRQNPISLKTMVLLDKHKDREVSITVDYALHKISDAFVIGYGLDMHEYERNLKGIYSLEN